MNAPAAVYPARWRTIRSRFVARLNPTKRQVAGLHPETPVSFVPMEAVGEYGGLDTSAKRALFDVLTGYTFFRDGDILVAKITPCFENGKGAIAANLSAGFGFGTTELHVISPSNALDGRFMFYVTMSHPFRLVGQGEMFGAGGQKRVPETFLLDFALGLPGVPEQRAIAAFLDRKTAAIDALIAKKERLIELLQEKRQALITQAVTKGLDPNVPMKEFKNPFLDRIPRHWEAWSVRDLLRMRHLEVQDGNHGELHPVASDYVDDGIPFLMASNLRGGHVDLVGCKFIPLHLAEELRIGFARKGDVLLTHKGTLGETAILLDLTTPYAMLTPQVTYYRPRNFFERSYLYFFMTSELLQEQLRFISSVQSTRGYVGITAQRDLMLLVPPLEEQRTISRNLEPQIRRANHVLAAVRRSTIGLREYRQALITAAVTGQIDLSTEAA